MVLECEAVRVSGKGPFPGLPLECADLRTERSCESDHPEAVRAVCARGRSQWQVRGCLKKTLV